MRRDPTDLALKNLERLVSRDPILRDIVNPTLPTARRQARLVPPVDVVETETEWTLLIELPGVPKDGVKLRIDGTRLVVRGEKPTLRTGKARVAERETGPFVREFLLPFQIDAERIRAALVDGVLTVVLPRAGGDRAREILIDI